MARYPHISDEWQKSILGTLGLVGEVSRWVSDPGAGGPKLSGKWTGVFKNDNSGLGAGVGLATPIRIWTANRPGGTPRLDYADFCVSLPHAANSQIQIDGRAENRYRH